MKIIYKKLYEGFKGRIAWYFLNKKYEANNYILFPSNDQDFNKWGILLLPAYMKKSKFQKVVVLSSDKRIRKAIQCVNSNNVVIKQISQKQMKQYISYYALINKSKEWRVVSVTQPYETGADRLLGIKGITKRDIVYYDVYGFGNEDVNQEIEKDLEQEVEKCLLG